jgi:hypothetical protein
MARTHAKSHSRVTTNRDEIKKWAEERGGRPATVTATERDDEAGILRIKLDPKDKALEGISWDDFFRKFDEKNLAFLYEDKTADGHVSRFHKFIKRPDGDRGH